ncbi:MAG: flagellar export chaperone FliS, partial [Halofilum sp. (in: g-proteobacteria)]|nr:flagellar export chaperone FliS [Halofilum sp. (in: g-proteobacteria)]
WCLVHFSYCCFDFMYSHLSQANIKRDPEMIADVVKILEELNEGWKQIADSKNQTRTACLP